VLYGHSERSGVLYGNHIYIVGQGREKAMGYAEEKFGNAKRLLGRRKGGLREALYLAFVEIRTIPESDLPVSMRLEFKGLIGDLTSVDPVGDEGRARATIASLSDQEVDAMVRRICEFDDRLMK